MHLRRPPGTSISVAPSNAVSVQPISRAARAGYSPDRSWVTVKMMLATSSISIVLASTMVSRSSRVARRTAVGVSSEAVVAPRIPRVAMNR